MFVPAKKDSTTLLAPVKFVWQEQWVQTCFSYISGLYGQKLVKNQSEMLVVVHHELIIGPLLDPLLFALRAHTLVNEAVIMALSELPYSWYSVIFVLFGEFFTSKLALSVYEIFGANADTREQENSDILCIGWYYVSWMLS